MGDTLITFTKGETMSVAVDIHNHFLPESWPDLAERFGEPNWPWMKHLGCGKAMLMVGNDEFRPVYSATWDVAKRLEEMDRDGVDHQIMSVTPILFAYLRRPEHALDCARMFNDMALEMCARSGDRIHAVAQVPLQDVDASCREVERRWQMGTSASRLATTSETRTLTTKASSLSYTTVPTLPARFLNTLGT
jgi:aminocarboxymuconate-semialdehyde decarboxylase